MDIKEEPIMESIDLRKSVLQSESSKMSPGSSSKSDNENIPVTSMRHQRRVQSMISVRKDYSCKYTSNSKSKAPITTSQEKSSSFNCLDISQKVSQSSFGEQNQNAKRELGNLTAPVSSNKQQHMPSHKGLVKRKEQQYPTKRSIKPNISILERHDYDKGPAKVMKLEKFENIIKTEDEEESEDIESSSSCSAIDDNNKIKSTLPLKLENLKELTVPIERLNIEGNYRKKSFHDEKNERDELKVIVAHEEIEDITPSTTIVKQEQDATASTTAATLRQQTLSTESKDSQNINKINNKINIIFQLNDNTKRKNIILHRRTPKKMVQKITIKEANNNSTKSQSDDATLVPDKKLSTRDTQTEDVLQKRFSMNMSMTNPLTDDVTEYLFFENDIMISLQCNTISFFEYHRLNSLLKKGEPDFKLIDRINRRLHDIQVDSDNKYQRLCYNDSNSLPIYLEMRAKQKDLDDPEMCPIAFLYCNIYYIDQKRTKFSSVHLDTVKSIVHDIKYTTVPHSSYFIMSWHEKSTDTKSNITGIVKYKLTPNLDLAKLASIRQFPKLSYQIKQMYCGKGKCAVFCFIISFL